MIVPSGIVVSTRPISLLTRMLQASGYALEALAERGRLPAGAVVLNKPYRKADLAKRVREALTPATV